MGKNHVDKFLHCRGPRRVERKRRIKLEEIMAENFPNLMKEVKIQDQEAQKSPTR